MSLADVQAMKALKLSQQHAALLATMSTKQGVYTDKTFTFTSGGYYDRNGAFATGTDQAYTTFALSAGDTFKISGTSYFNMPLYTFVGSDGSKVSYPVSSAAEAYNTDVVLTVNTSGTLYVNKYNYAANSVIKVAKATSYKAVSFDFVPSYSQQTPIYKSGQYYDRTGALVTAANYFYTSLPVVSGDKYKITGSDYYNMPLYLFVDKSGNKTVYPASQSTGKNYYNVDFTANADGTLYINKNWLLSPIVLKQSGNTLNNNPLYTKVMYADGDSVAKGEGSNFVSYVDIIANNNAMGYNKAAVSGTTLAVRSGRTDSILERIKALTGVYDYILLEGGYNDMFNTVAIGALTSGYTAVLDETTVIGAVESMCKSLITNYPTTKKLFVLGHRAIGLDGSYATQTDTYWNAIQSALEKWSIPYIDIRKSGGLMAYNQTWLTNYFGSTETMGTHPNYNGYLNFYVPQITAKLKTL